ncbi:MAG: threonine synthase [Bacteroidota bacterium]
MTSFLTHLACSVCRRTHSHRELQTVCTECGRSLLAVYDLQGAKQKLDRQRFLSEARNFWDFFPLLPVGDKRARISLGETLTPVIPLSSLQKSLGLAGVWVKDEACLPTGSFKARGLALAVSKAKELGVREVCIPSAGNAAGALAAYAARAGISSHIFLPSDTPAINIKECAAFGAAVTLVPGTISDAAAAMREKRKSHAGWFDVSTLKEPYRLEGKKTIGYELFSQFEGNLPDVILYPTGGGTGLIGMWKAFGELEELGWKDNRRPRMISVQMEGCAPIVQAFRERKKESVAWPDAHTVASGLRVPKAFADHLILDALYASGGTAVAVSDADAVEAIRETGRNEGIYFCPEGAATVVALKHLVAEGSVKTTDRVLIFNTAAGAKYPEVMTPGRNH